MIFILYSFKRFGLMSTDKFNQNSSIQTSTIFQIGDYNFMLNIFTIQFVSHLLVIDFFE